MKDLRLISKEDSSLVLRTWRMEDLSSLVKHANNFNIWINLRDAFPHPYNEESGKGWLQMALAEENNLLLAIELNGEAVGGIGAHFHPDVYRINAEIGYWLSEEFWGHGIVTRSVQLLTTYLFDNYPDIQRIYADLFASNRPSARVLEKCGFSLEAVHKRSVIKNGQILDEHRWVRFREL
ncbi:MAG: GNAT family N-acetyltransferase [Bacteroidales bacterium]|jgi:RimJ/RimL family protein N-acetyltransferase|nr:GNAT family N-acetyltransferase [Bacteroidales bacterium]MDD2570764.1 GNAT family protein [Bacteroidales bacterium]MDD2813583.1 GNAT family protein [Bacteroidales bacterium]MDD3385828.1 GNAT family protein [Bacteroidales bacterium]MDD3811792.1 GNAT family protein [Bacteroidales bacterium]